MYLISRFGLAWACSGMRTVREFVLRFSIGLNRMPIVSLAIVYNTCTLFSTRECYGVNRAFHIVLQFDVHVVPNHVMRFTEDGDLTKSRKSVQGFLDFLEDNSP
jgi:hypothetical protein